MEIMLLVIGMLAKFFCLYLAIKFRAMMWSFFGAFIGLAVILSIAASSNTITYVTNGTTVVLNGGEFFFLIPLMLLIASLLQIVSLK